MLGQEKCMQILDGKQLAETVAEELRERVSDLRAAGIHPRLAILLVGESDMPTEKYVAAKQRAADKVGVAVELIRFTIDEPIALAERITARIEELNSDPDTHGIILQLPMPVPMNEQDLIDAIAPEKDVDGLTTTNQAALEVGRELFVPATPQGILRLLAAYKIPIANTKIAMIGQGRLVGKPLSAMLRSRDAILTTADSKTPDLLPIVKDARVIISAVGQPGIITDAMVRSDSILIDVGLSDIDGTLTGDIEPEVKALAGQATPVPGGVGPMTVISLLANVVLAAELARIQQN